MTADLSRGCRGEVAGTGCQVFDLCVVSEYFSYCNNTAHGIGLPLSFHCSFFQEGYNGRMKKQSTSDRDIELMFEIGTLRHIERTWKNFLNPDVANCAEHMFRVLWLALTIARMEKVGNHEKILKIALMHDVMESRTGDTNYISRQYVKRNDTMAADDIFEGTVHEQEAEVLFKEYEERNSIEAKIVKDADTIDVEMELAEMRAKGHSLGKVFVKDRKANVYPRLFTKSARKLWDGIATAEPHAWHLTSPRNRHAGGDWKKKK